MSKYHLILSSFVLFFITACSNPVNRDEHFENSSYLNAPESSYIVDYLEPKLNANPQKTGVLSLINGVDAFAARLMLIHNAKRSIDFQYYIYKTDETGNMIAWQLFQAAERGVRVRVLLDDTTSKLVDPKIIALAHHANIEIRLFNPVASRRFSELAWLFNFPSLNHRMHNKSLTVDNLASIVGGRNIADEYFGANETFGFGDFDLLTVGKVVPEVSTQFDDYWKSSTSVPLEQLMPRNLSRADLETEVAKLHDSEANEQDNLYFQKVVNSNLYKGLKNDDLVWFWGDGTIFYDPPDKRIQKDDSKLMVRQIFRHLKAAKDRVVIVSPYFVPTAEGANILISLANKGIDVTVITNSLAATDVVAVHAGYRNYRKQLLKGGVKLYEVKAKPGVTLPQWSKSSRASLHAKTFLIDDDQVFVGSFNFDPRSAWINTEMGLYFEQVDFVKRVNDYIVNALPIGTYRLTLNNGKMNWVDDTNNQIYTKEPQANLTRKLNANFISILPVESQL